MLENTHLLRRAEKKRGERGEGGRRAPLPPKCYKIDTFSGGQKERGGESEARGGGGVHRCRHIITSYYII